MIQIYTISCPTTQQIKYIGKTKHELTYRLNQHIRTSKIKNNLMCSWIKSLTKANLIPIIEQIDYCDTNDMANILECMYIGLFKSWGFDLKNGTGGGDGQCNMSQETKNKISVAKKGKCTGKDNSFFGKKHTDETKIKMQNAPRPEYFAQQCSDIVKELHRTGILNNKGINHPNCRPIGQYDKDNNLIKTYEYISLVEKDGFCRRNIHNCLDGSYKTHHGYIWKYI